jgi:hypothetical protein
MFAFGQGSIPEVDCEKMSKQRFPASINSKSARIATYWRQTRARFGQDGAGFWDVEERTTS